MTGIEIDLIKVLKKFWKVLSYTAKLQFPSHSARVEVLLCFRRILNILNVGPK